MKTDTQALIDSLAQGVKPVRPMVSPGRLLASLGLVLTLYAFGTDCFMGWRPDLAIQFGRPPFLAEVGLLAALAAASLAGAVYLAFPDQYQHPFASRLPLWLLAALILLLGVQAFLPADPRMILPMPGETHSMGCTVCIGLVSLLPSALMLVVLRAGASAAPPLSGLYIVLAAASLGCLIVRLKEMNDSLLHLAAWHYLPTLVFAALGALIGKYFLRW